MSSDAQAVPPLLPEGATFEVAENVHVIPDQRIEFVPNVGIVVGDRSALVIDTAMGPTNGERLRRELRALTDLESVLLSITHFHPEHGFGAQSLVGEATIVYNAAQARELADKGEEYIAMFSGFGSHLAELLADVRLVAPHVAYGGETEIDLGGTTARLSYHGPAHTRGDQVIFLPEQRVLFTGDLVEARFFPIMPDEDADGSAWIALLERLEALEPDIVVPGHGEVGDASLIRETRGFLETVRDRVGERHSAGRSLEQMEEELVPELLAAHPDWDNQMWVKPAIGRFHAELV